MVNNLGDRRVGGAWVLVLLLLLTACVSEHMDPTVAPEPSIYLDESTPLIKDVIIPMPSATYTPTASSAAIPTGTERIPLNPIKATTNIQTKVGGPTPGSTGLPTRTKPYIPVNTTTLNKERSAVPAPPKRNPYELARSLVHKTSDFISALSYDRPPNFDTGYKDTFNVINMKVGNVDNINATLKLISDNTYWFVDDSLDISYDDLKESARVFEHDIIPRVIKLYGPIWPEEAVPGYKITILHTRLRGHAGYYSSADEYPTSVHQYSNNRKMIYINVHNLRVGSDRYLSTLAHELQHVVQWNANRGQSTWLNEGLSQIVESEFGRLPRTVDSYRNSLPTSLVYWPVRGEGHSANYGASFLFTKFLVDQHGLIDNMYPLINMDVNGIYAVNQYLDFLNIEETFESLFGRWIVANYVSESPYEEYRYESKIISVEPTDMVNEYGVHHFSQPQYSSRYILLDLNKTRTKVQFSGQNQVNLFEEDPEKGNHCWWSNRGDSISTTLTREFNLSYLKQATLQFSVWYDIEEYWDYGYVEVSSDGGSTWDILKGEASIIQNPFGNGYGPGYSGVSGGWIQDQVDLTPYSGRKILIRFHYVTDDAINGSGMCVDSIAIPELEFSDDMAVGNTWFAEGFYHTDNRMAQRYSVWLVQMIDDKPIIKRVYLDDLNRGEIIIPRAVDESETLIIVGSMTDGSNIPAEYLVKLISLD